MTDWLIVTAVHSVSSYSMPRGLGITFIKLSEVLSPWVWVEIDVIAMKGYSTLPRSPELESYHQMQFSVTPRKPLFSGGVGIVPLPGI